jgi:hypothetical protein
MQEDMNKELTHSIQERDETIQGAPLCSYTYTWVGNLILSTTTVLFYVSVKFRLLV